MVKFKQVLSTAVVAALTVAVVPAFASDGGMTPPPPMNGNGAMGPGMMRGHPGPGGRPHGPMPRGGWMRNAPVPMLMPIVWRNAIDLKLTPAQETDLKNWRNTQWKAFSSWRHETQAHNAALRDALLNGESAAAVAPLKAAVVKDHEMMLEHGIQQVNYLHKILTPVQWQKVTRIYKEMGTRHGRFGHWGR